MSDTDTIYLVAADCLPFKNQQGHERAIQYFIENSGRWNTFHFTPGYTSDEGDELATYNYNTGKWHAGRLVGEANFTFNDKQYHIKVQPRFGLLQLFRMLEEIYNIRLTDSKGLFLKEKNFQFLIKKLISFLWLHLLSKANTHGLPRHTVKKQYKGSIIKGRIDVRNSVRPLLLEEKLVSTYREKALDETVSVILIRAYKVLLKEYYLSDFSLPANAKDAIGQLLSSKMQERNILDHEFMSIRYKSIYQMFKPVVDLSWDLIKGRNIGHKQSNKLKDSFSYFIDMAEIWELYLKSLLSKHLGKHNWTIKKEKLTAYEGKFFKKTLIPDMVFHKENHFLVWDAKYKLMRLREIDFDRGDFFQIHTYIHYLQQEKDVFVGGLLYPFAVPFSEDQQEMAYSDSLFGSDSQGTKFHINGIDLSFINEENMEDRTIVQLFNKAEEEFIGRIMSLLHAIR